MKTLRTVALIAGAVALAATGIGAVVGAAAFTAAAGVSAATIAGVASLVSLGASLGAMALAKKPTGTQSGSQTQFTLDPTSGIPIMLGRTYFSGRGFYRDSYDAAGSTKRAYQTFGIIFSGAGPIQEIEAFKADRATVTFDGSFNAVGGYHDYMWFSAHLGQTPEAVALGGHVGTGTLPGWGAASKLSGYAAGLWTLKFDKKGDKYPSGPPAPAIVGKGVKVYDPRMDSTYPGGVGACRALDESTYVWSENPWLHALTWALGRWQNGKRVAGVGMALAAISVPSFVEAANVADANDWKLGGVVYTTDSKWDVIKQMAQAGGGEIMRIGAKLTAFANAPKVSLATITSADLVGEGSLTATQSRRERINRVIPRVRLETHGWEVVPLDPITVPAYETEDGEQRTEEITYHLVQDKDQGAQLAMYDIVNAREFGPITLSLGPRWMGYIPGDCLTIDIAEGGMVAQKAVMIGRGLDPEAGMMTQVFRSETDAKHALALGQTGVAPPTPDLSVPDLSETDKPTGLTISASGTTADLTWRAPVEAFDYVKVFRNTANDFGTATAVSGNLVGALGGVMTYSDAGLAAATTFYWWVVAYNNALASAPEGPVTFTTA